MELCANSQVPYICIFLDVYVIGSLTKTCHRYVIKTPGNFFLHCSGDGGGVNHTSPLIKVEQVRQGPERNGTEKQIIRVN